MSRIVGGVAGGRRLTMPAGSETRPTADRTREALFSTLAAQLVTRPATGSTATPPPPSLAGVRFLDLYAGSGAVGLEAASRGAAAVDLVESSAVALRALRGNVDALGLSVVTVHATSVERFLSATATRPYDIVFLDPPYAVDVTGSLAALVETGWLAPDAVVVVERATRDAAVAWPPGLAARQTRRYGDTTLCYGSRS